MVSSGCVVGSDERGALTRSARHESNDRGQMRGLQPRMRWLGFIGADHCDLATRQPDTSVLDPNASANISPLFRTHFLPL